MVNSIVSKPCRVQLHSQVRLKFVRGSGSTTSIQNRKKARTQASTVLMSNRQAS